MPTPPSPTIAGTTTLSAIQTKVRRLTRSLSEQQLSTSDLNNYINTFTVYDFPEQLRTFNLRTTFTFWCNPYQDVYPTDTSIPAPQPGYENQSLYNFQNLYISVHPPVYIAGFQVFYTQSPQEFWGIYPFVNNISPTGYEGDGATTSFTGVINSGQSIVPSNLVQQICLQKESVLFSSIDTNNNGLAMIDTPINNTIGNLGVPGVGPSSTTVQDLANYINYITGQYVVTFPVAPGAGQAINSQSVPLNPARPQVMLYYANSFTLRPIPDQPYPVNFEVYQRPTALLSGNQSPELEEYWQLIAYGAARKVLQDRMDMETVQLIEPEFREQMNLCLRRTLVQQSNERSATIYTEGNGPNGWGFWGGFGGMGNQ
jgi:hypothetical protein